MSVADRIKELRVSRGLSQNALAKALGVSQPSIANYEKGRAPDVDFVYSFCNFMDVTADWLVFGKEPPMAETSDVGGSLKDNSLNLHDWDKVNPPTSEDSPHSADLSLVVKTQQDLIQAYKEIGDLKEAIGKVNVKNGVLETENTILKKEKERLLERILELEGRTSAASATPAPDAPEANPINDKRTLHYGLPPENNNQPPKP